MSVAKFYQFISDDEAVSQKCRLPSDFILNSNIKTGDVVSINCRTCSYICRVYPQPTTKLEDFIEISSTVSCNSFPPQRISSNSKHEHLLQPENFQVIKTTVFDKLQVKVVFHHDKRTLLVKSSDYCDIVFRLLRNYVIKKNAVVQCQGRNLADLFQIHSIFISETYREDGIYGRLTRTGVVEITEMISKEQLNLLNKFENVEIGGTGEAEKILSNYLFQKETKKIIIVGPSGCGKSLLVKKFCCSLKCNLVIVDMQDGELTADKCEAYSKRLIEYSQVFQCCPTILLVDHIDAVASISIKQHRQNSVAGLLYLFESLKGSSVSIIVVAQKRELLHPAISSLFEDEVFLGVPSFHQRKKMLMALTKSFSLRNIDYDKIASMTPGFIACDIAQLLQDAVAAQKRLLLQNTIENEVLNTHHFEKALLLATPSLLKTSNWNMKVKPVCWNDIGGMEGIKERLQLSIERPLRHPEIFQKVDLRCPRGVLLFGPPGCCKTTLARGLATECNANFFAANPSQIYSSYVGESEANISHLFYQARLCAPSIIFLDELDSLVGCRTFDTKQQGVAEKILSTLLIEMDGLGVKTSFGETSSTHKAQNEDLDENDVKCKKQLQDEVIVVGATNRPDCIDDALLRPGRFDIIVYVPPPNLEERLSILQTLTRNTLLHKVDLKKIAEKTHNFTGADLKNICDMAAMNALKEHLQNAEYVTEQNFLQALEKAQPSITKEQIQMYEQLSNKYGPITSRE